MVMLYGHNHCQWNQKFVEPKNLQAMMAWAAKELHFHGSPPELEERLKGSGIYPSSSCDFWRLRAPLRSSSDIVDFDSADTGAHWHCCGCAHSRHKSEPQVLASGLDHRCSAEQPAIRQEYA